MKREMLYKALINEQLALDVTEADVRALDVVAVDQEHFHVIVGTESLLIEVLHYNPEEKLVELKVRDQILRIELSDPVEVLVKEMGFERNGQAHVNEITAPMPGKVLSLLAADGSEVEEGSPLVILEAMKMENVLSAPRNAVIEKVHVVEGQTVDKAQVLVTLKTEV